MNGIAELDATNRVSWTATARWPRYRKLVQVGALAAILLMAVIAAGRFTGRGGSAPSPALAAMAQAVEFAQGVKTMHISAKMRTMENDNFDSINLNAPLIRVEMWKQFGDSPRVRVQKQGRQIVADNKSTIMLIGTSGTPLAVKIDGLNEATFASLAPLLHPDTLFERESQAAGNPDADVTVETRAGADGRKKTIVTISAKAQGDFSESEHRKNTSIIESDNIRTYTFDAESSRCEAVQVYVRTERGKVLVFETSTVEYGIPLSSSLFQLDVPKSAVWVKEPSGVGAKTDTSSMQPDEVARKFFDALSRSDWQGVSLFTGSIFDNPDLRKMFGGLTVISIGKPFQSGLYRGWFVPYEIKLKSGEVKKHNLAIRNDNPERQWKWDGGL